MTGDNSGGTRGTSRTAARALERAQNGLMSEDELTELRAQAAEGDADAVAQLVELAGERGDLDELRRLAAAGSADAVDVLVEVAGEQGNVAELRRLAELGNRDAADVLAELGEE
jgi:hypothetical protein